MMHGQKNITRERGSVLSRFKKFDFSKNPNGVWGPASLLHKTYRRHFHHC